MLVKRIKDIKNIEAFDTFNWVDADLAKYNLIYGWNGSGKTTLSRIFSFLERRSIHLPELIDVEFTIQTHQAGLIKHCDIASHRMSVRVFNEDFIKENLLFEQSQAKKIIILGRENVAIQKEITDLSQQYEARHQIVQQLEDKIDKLPKLKEVLTDAGRDVPTQFAGTPLAFDKYFGRSYDRTKVEKKLESGTLTEANCASFIINDPLELEKKKVTIKGEKTKVTFNPGLVPDFSSVFENANGILSTPVKVQMIEEMKSDKPLCDWIEAGYILHRDRSLSNCQFCRGSLPEDLLIKLSAFFTDELLKMKNQIETMIESLKKNESIQTTDQFDFKCLFSSLEDEYKTLNEELNSQINVIKERISLLVNYLKDKKANLYDETKVYPFVSYPSEAIELANTNLKQIESLIEKHNKKVEAYSEEIQQAAESIEHHIIASILSNKDFFSKKKEEDRLLSEVKTAKEDRARLVAEIQLRKGSLHNVSDAIDKINSILQEFFGANAITLEVVESPDGKVAYVLKRKGKEAKYLSEGEESVLALVYFLVKLEEDGCDKKNCLVVIDDPVDSQDNIFLFRTAGLLKRQIQDVGQCVIFTHSFDFFNLIRDWLLSKKMENDSALFSITHDREAVPSLVSIQNLPELIRDYKSEYQYLFQNLYQFSNGTKSLDAPLVPNIARKILEYFACFKWSCRNSEEFTSIILNRFVADQNLLKKGTGDFIVKFLHEYSHGQDFTRPISASTFEAKPIAQNVLKFIQLADSEHYSELSSKCEETIVA